MSRTGSPSGGTAHRMMTRRRRTRSWWSSPFRPSSPERTHLRVVETGVERLSWSDGDKESYVEDHQGGWVQCFTRLAGLFATAGQG